MLWGCNLSREDGSVQVVSPDLSMLSAGVEAAKEPLITAAHLQPHVEPDDVAPPSEQARLTAPGATAHSLTPGVASSFSSTCSCSPDLSESRMLGEA